MDQENKSIDTKMCPYCAQTIKAAAVLCPFCNRTLPIEPPAAIRLAEKMQQNNLGYYVNTTKSPGGWVGLLNKVIIVAFVAFLAIAAVAIRFPEIFRLFGN